MPSVTDLTFYSSTPDFETLPNLDADKVDPANTILVGYGLCRCDMDNYE